MRVGNLGFEDLLGNGEEGIEAFGNGPGQALLLRLILDIARGHVDCEEVA